VYFYPKTQAQNSQVPSPKSADDTGLD